MEKIWVFTSRFRCDIVRVQKVCREEMIGLFPFLCKEKEASFPALKVVGAALFVFLHNTKIP